jgi:putative endonuclease
VLLDSNYSRGVAAEKLVCEFYLKHGYTLLARRYRNECGEIDIIARKSSVLVFVEVKSRNNLEHMDVIKKKQVRRCIEAANIFAATYGAANNFEYDLRFDLAIVVSGHLHRIIPNAWTLDNIDSFGY